MAWVANYIHTAPSSNLSVFVDNQHSFTRIPFCRKMEGNICVFTLLAKREETISDFVVHDRSLCPVFVRFHNEAGT